MDEARKSRIIINGVDVSRSVAAGGVQVEWPTHGPVKTHLTLFAIPELVGDEIRLTLGDAQPVWSANSPLAKERRALWMEKGPLK